jgi:hypothetical protein
MGLVFFRKISRTGISYSWPEMPPGQWVFENHARFLFQDLHQPMLLELLPSVTYGISQTRAPTQQWNPAIDRFEVGLSAKYGITSNITLDATINPDFSQVESDAFQVQVNQRFPIFYSEKRPFFMEGMGLFNLAGTGGDGNMRTAVHTRRIINPLWGSKLTGTAGKLTFGLLNASDETPEDIGGRGEVITGRKKLFTIGRATYSLGKSDYVGVILTDAEHAGRSNRVGGGDLSIKLSPRQQLSTTFLFSHTGVSFSDSHQSVGAQVSYSYNTRRFTWSNQIEHYGREFQMDTAFYNRVGFTSGWSFGEINFYPKPDSKFWLKRVHPFYWAKRGYDSIQNGTDEFLHTGIRFNFTRQGFFNLSHSRGHEPWMGQSFKTGALVNLFGSTQIFRWLSIEGSFRNTNSIYYDRVSPFQGKARSGSFGFSLQPNQHLQQNVDYDGISFRRASTGEQIYTVHIINTQTTYQFNKHFRLRLLEQFDSSQRRLLTDFLAMYELVPGTVFHAGYGSLNERQSTFDGRYLTVTRGLFFKASYRHRF